MSGASVSSLLTFGITPEEDFSALPLTGHRTSSDQEQSQGLVFAGILNDPHQTVRTGVMESGGLL